MSSHYSWHCCPESLVVAASTGVAKRALRAKQSLSVFISSPFSGCTYDWDVSARLGTFVSAPDGTVVRFSAFRRST